MELEDFFVWQNSVFLAFVKVTYITEWYKWHNNIKASIVEKSLKIKWHIVKMVLSV